MEKARAEEVLCTALWCGEVVAVAAATACAEGQQRASRQNLRVWPPSLSLTRLSYVCVLGDSIGCT